MSDLLYSEEEEALRAAVRDLLTDHCDTTSVLARAESDAPLSPCAWSAGPWRKRARTRTSSATSRSEAAGPH
ncbi:hypothetical protein ABZ486_17280, partial [Streptomyces albogriseolus]